MQVAHARCLSYPVPLDALGIVEAVAQTDGKRLVGLSAEAQLLAVSEAVKRQSVSRAGPLSSGGDEDVRMGSEEGLGGEGGEGGEDDCDEEEEGRGRDAHQI